VTRRISFHELAEQELIEAASYYNSQRPGLGSTFLDEVERAINQVRENPEAAPLVNRLVRRKLVRRFPYSIMYSVQSNSVHILAVANQRRRPFYWRGRR
jgi:plasmid stabilization system protein ParE